MLDDLPASGSLRRSSELVRGHWWRTFGFTALVDVLAVLSGPLLGVGLLLLTDHSLNFINLAASLVYTFTVPYAAIQLTLYYFDLEARAAADTEVDGDVSDRSTAASRQPSAGSVTTRAPGALHGSDAAALASPVSPAPFSAAT